MLPFGVNCRLQVAGLGKKREEGVKPTFKKKRRKQLWYKSFTVFFARWGVKFDRPSTESKSRPVEFNNSTIELNVPSRRKKILKSYRSVDFDSPSMSRCVTAQVSVNSQIHVIKTSHFHFYCIRLIFKKNPCGNPSTIGFLGFLNQVLAFPL